MRFVILLCSLLNITMLCAQEPPFRVMSYNVENLFDTTDNPQTKDDDYTYSGAKRWTKGRYYHKLQQIAKVIVAAGGWGTPAVVGLCEVENDSTILHLLNRTPLRNQNYRYVITHSQDRRGINCAFIYQRDRLAYINHASYRIQFENEPAKRSRDLLHLCGRVITGDTIDFFMIHFPSRYGGERASEPYRKAAARLLKEKTDSLMVCRANPNILIMGDFNDPPTYPALTQTLQAAPLLETPQPKQLYNLFAPPYKLPLLGTHKYQGEWSILDQFIASGNLCDTTRQTHIRPLSPTLFCAPFLLKKDPTHRGIRPNRTHYGYKYEKGYSDHLPILLDISLSTRQ